MSDTKSPPDWHSPVPPDVPAPEFEEGRELNFDTLQHRVFRRARIYLDAECFENGGSEFVNVRFIIDSAALYGLSDAEIDELMRKKLRGAVEEARECYVKLGIEKGAHT